MTKFRTILNNNIRYFIDNQNVKLSGLGKDFGYSRSTVSNYYNDKAIPDIEFLLKFAQKFNVSVNDLLTKDLSASDFVSEPEVEYNRQNKDKEIEYLKKEIAIKDKLIAQLEKMVSQYEKMFDKLDNDIKRVEKNAKDLLPGKDVVVNK